MAAQHKPSTEAALVSVTGVTIWACRKLPAHRAKPSCYQNLLTHLRAPMLSSSYSRSLHHLHRGWIFYLGAERKMRDTKTPQSHTLWDLYSTATRFLAAVTICLLPEKEQGIALAFCWWPSIPQGRQQRLIWKISRLRTWQSQAPTLSAARLDQRFAWQGILIPHIFHQALKKWNSTEAKICTLVMVTSSIYFLLSNSTLLHRLKVKVAIFLKGPQRSLKSFTCLQWRRHTCFCWAGCILPEGMFPSCPECRSKAVPQQESHVTLLALLLRQPASTTARSPHHSRAVCTISP